MERNVPFSQGVDFFFRHHCQIGLKPPEDVYSYQNINASMQLSHTDTQQQGTNLDRWAFCAQSTSPARCGQHWSLAPELVCEICLWRERRQYRWAHPQPADARPSLRHPEEQLHQCTPKERWHGYTGHIIFHCDTMVTNQSMSLTGWSGPSPPSTLNPNPVSWFLLINTSSSLVLVAGKTPPVILAVSYKYFGVNVKTVSHIHS